MEYFPSAQVRAGRPSRRPLVLFLSQEIEIVNQMLKRLGIMTLIVAVCSAWSVPQASAGHFQKGPVMRKHAALKRAKKAEKKMAVKKHHLGHLHQ